MKYLTLAVTMAALLSSVAFANESKFSAKGNFAITDSDSTIDCDRIAQVLPSMSSSDLKFEVTKACRVKKVPNQFVEMLIRIVTDIATYGFNEIACRQPGGSWGCRGPVKAYKALEASITVLSSNKNELEGRPVVMNPEECLIDAGVLSKLSLSAKNVALKAFCEEGTLHTSLILLK